MMFDAAVSAQQAFARARDCNELGEEMNAAVEAEERFSNGVGEEASEAYRELVAIGERHPQALAFREFLVYITWCHLMDETQPEHFRRGLILCDDLLERDDGKDPERLRRLREIRRSFRTGLGEASDDLLDYEADTPKGGD